MPVPEDKRRKEGESSVVSDLDEFKRNWSIFSEGSLSQLKDWNNVIAAVRDSVVTCVRTKNAISIHCKLSSLPFASAEILAGFDIDAHDGTRVRANPRAIVAMMRQCNTTDVTRRSSSYEVRLSKYARRGYKVYVPSLARADIDPTIFEHLIIRVEGLARLLVLERLATFDERQS
ncbi:hypothetical protein F5887DRAFT_873273, partial [Amanita rubescens]